MSRRYVSRAPCAEVGLVAGDLPDYERLNLGRFHTGGGGTKCRSIWTCLLTPLDPGRALA